MTEREFQTNMRAAKTFLSLSQDPAESDFWTGYLRGMRRHYHGEAFGTEEEHQKWLSLLDDPTRREMGLGYWVGASGQNVQIAMKTMAKREYMAEIGRRGGQKSRRTLTTEQAREMVRARKPKNKNGG